MQAPAIIPTSVMPAQAGLSLADMIAEFIAFVDVRPASQRTYLTAIRQFWVWTRERGGRLDRETVMAWRDALAAAGKKAATVQLYLVAVKRFCAWASATGRLDAREAEGVKAVKAPRVSKEFKRDCLSAAQARELLASIDVSELAGKRDYALLALMLSTGIRDCEAARARIFDLRVIAGQSALAIQGKGRDEADACVKIAAPVEKALRAYLMARGEADKAAPLFHSLSNRNASKMPLTTRSISRVVKTRLRAIGLDSGRLSAHSLRHTAATLNLLGGGSLEETQALLRHASVTTTMKYAHHLSWAERQAERRIADAIF